MKRKIRRVDRSPMNPLIWVIELECGHEIYQTQKARPRTYSLTTAPDGDVLQGPRFLTCAQCVNRRQP